MNELLDTLAGFFFDNAEGLTCGEAEAVADAYRSVGDNDTAQGLIEAHAYGDDEGDMHFDQRTEDPLGVIYRPVHLNGGKG